MKKNTYIKIVALVILCILISIQLYDIRNNYKTVNKPNIVEKEKKDIEEKNNQAIKEESTSDYETDNKDVVGKLTIEGTNIDEYILKTTDNNYYLSHNINKEEDVAGAVFMDYRNNVDDKKILIFGHNASYHYSSPFHDLENYGDYEFYINHKYINLDLNYKKSKWLIFSVMIVSRSENFHMQLKFDNNSWNDHINYIKNNSIYDTSVNISSNDNIVIIQTCNYNPDNTYILICAKKIQ